jgi:hypothetical protein
MPHPTEPVAVRHPLTGQFVTLDPAVDYDPSDELVAAYPWAFAPRDTRPDIIESVPVEKATAEPGQKRTRTKSAK